VTKTEILRQITLKTYLLFYLHRSTDRQTDGSVVEQTILACNVLQAKIIHPTTSYKHGLKHVDEKQLNILDNQTQFSTTDGILTTTSFYLHGQLFWNYSQFEPISQKLTYQDCSNRTFYTPDSPTAPQSTDVR